MSTLTETPRRQHGFARASRRGGVVALVLALVVLGVGTSAWAYWSTTGSGSGSATTGTLNAPTGVLAGATSGSSTVNVSWTAPTSGATPAGYYVTRTRTSDSSTAPACRTSATQLTSATAVSCVDPSVPDGTYTYQVTAVLNGWSATSGPSTNVTVASVVSTTTTLASDSNPSVVGQTVTYTATVAPSAGSGTPTGSVTFFEGSTAICSSVTLSAGRATCTQKYSSTGGHSISASYAGGGSYGASASGALNQNVNQGSQTITFTSAAPTTARVGGPAYSVSATGGASGNPVTFSSGSPTVCSVSGSIVSFSAVGTCVVNADQAGSVNYAAASQKQQSFSVGKGSQSITFTSTAPQNAIVGGSTYVVTATGGASGNPVTFMVDPTASTVCSVGSDGKTVSFLGAGTCIVDADQAGNTNYNAATRAQQNIAVGPGNQAINFTSTAPSNAQVEGAKYTVAATGGASGNAVTFSVDSSSTGVCSLGGDGKTVSFQAVGTCKINANQAGNANYNAAPQVAQSFSVAPGSQTITFTSTAPTNPQVGGSTYTVTATGGASGNAVTFSVDSSSTSVCSLGGDGKTVSFQAVGTCKINANQAGNANYNAAAQVQQSFQVAKGNQTITFTSTPPSDATATGTPYTVTATASSGLTVTFSASPTAVCTISGSTVSFVGTGTCIITANQAGNGDYNSASPVQQSIAVGALPPSPTNVAASPQQTGNAVVGTWSAVAGATSYECQLTKDAAAPTANGWTTCISGSTAVSGKNQNNKFNVRAVRGGAPGNFATVSF